MAEHWPTVSGLVGFTPNTNGWRSDLEDFTALLHKLTPVQSLRALRSTPFEAPPSMDYQDWHVIENQANMGSCVGSSGSSIIELCNKIATGDLTTQLSKWWCYRQSQMKGGITGDRGAMLGDMMWVSKNRGACKESTVPYPKSYSRTIPNLEAATAEAKQFIIQQHVDIRSYEDAFEFLSKGLGAIQIGIAWPRSWMNLSSPYLTSYPGGDGGHALMVCGYLAEKDNDGNNWLTMPNTWGRRWGKNGWAYLSRRCWNMMSASRSFQAIGYSDMKTLHPRVPRFMI
ncbi:MAG: hypothetical protein O3C28_18545 [Proteobacteria bacterium]|nr:hypothetical protein [Pseudomonadota bacterium]